MDPANETVFQHVTVLQAHVLPALVETICPKCQKSLGASSVPFVLRIIENAHKCINSKD